MGNCKRSTVITLHLAVSNTLPNEQLFPNRLKCIDAVRQTKTNQEESIVDDSWNVGGNKLSVDWTAKLYRTVNRKGHQESTMGVIMITNQVFTFTRNSGKQ